MRVQAKSEGKPLFLLELAYAGLFRSDEYSRGSAAAGAADPGAAS